MKNIQFKDHNQILNQKGFSLVEIAVVLAILGILLVGSISLTSTQREAAKYSDSNGITEQIKTALLVFVKVNKFLPCPDTDSQGDANYGQENRNANGRCTNDTGGVPFLALGLKENEVEDGFNVPVLYAINQGATVLANVQDATHSASYFCNADCDAAGLPRFDLDTPPLSTDTGTANLFVCAETETSSCTIASDMAAEGLSAVLVAFNKRGKINCNARALFEKENCDGDALFWDRGYITNETAPFDDDVLGISGYEIKQAVLF